MSNLLKQLEELDIMRCSLLPGEDLSLVLPHDEREQWESLIQLFSESSNTISASPPPSPCRFHIKVEGAPARVEIEFPSDYPDSNSAEIYVRGDDIDRDEQEHLQKLIKDAQEELRGTDIEYPIYNLVSSTVLPLLHEKADSCRIHNNKQDHERSDSTSTFNPNTELIFHALFTSHHLISPTKRRNMQKWANDLSLHGFAKIGYPGCIYCEGQQSDVEEFVANVKAMQWLALRLRFIEPLEERYERLSVSSQKRDRLWTEFEKVGEVVEFMRRLGRENFVTEMGLGPANLA